MTSRSAIVSFNPPSGGSMYFDGTGDYLSIPFSSDFDLTTNNTFECWVYYTSGVAQGVMSYTTTAAPTVGTQVSYVWFITAAGTLRFDVNGTGGGTETTVTTTTIPSNTWTHIAVVKTGTNITQYINGVSSSTGTFSGTGNAASASWSFRVGTYYTSALSFNGYISDVRVTKGVARYSTTFTPPIDQFSENSTVDTYYANVVLLIHGNGVHGSTVFKDSSAVPKTITAAGNAQISTTQSKFAPGTPTSYTVTSTPGGISATGFASPIIVSGLTNGTSYTFSVQALEGGSGFDPYYSNVSLLLSGDGANGSTNIFDSSPILKPVSVFGNAQISTAQSKFGGSSMYFDGSGDYLSVPASTSLNLTSGDFTIECWVYPITNGTIILDKDGVYGVSYPQFQLAFDSASKFGGYLGNGNGVSPSGTSVAGSTVRSLNTWYHIALVVSGTTVSLYVNGVLDATGTKPPMYEGNKPLLIGGTNIGTAGASYFNGYIDDLRITKGVARYTTTFTPPKTIATSQLSAKSAATIPSDPDPYYPNVSLLLHGDGTNGSTSIVDSSVSPKTVTVSGNAQISTAQSKFGGSSMYFDGTGDYLTLPSDVGLQMGTGDFTAEAWIYPTAGGFYQRIFTSTLSGFATTTIVVRLTLSNAIYGYAGGAAGITGSVVTLNTWSHVALVRISGTCYLYLNGVLQGSEYSPNSSTEYLKYVGGYYTLNGTEYFNGYIDELRITKGFARYTQNFALPATAYPSTKSSKDPYYNNVSLLLHGDGLNNGTAIYDSSLVPKTATNSLVTTVNTSPYFGSGSLKFTSSSYLEYANNVAFSPSTGDFTLECFVTLTSYNGSGSYVYTRFNPAVLNTDEFRIGIGATGYIFAGWDYPGNIFGVQAMSAAGAIPLNTRTHIAVVKYDLKSLIFVNGVLVASATAIAHPPTSAQKVTIGNLSSGNATYGIIGRLEELRITKGFARYTSAFSVPTDSLPDVLPTPDPYYRNTALILHGNGVDGTSNFIDNSPLTGTLTAVGNITHTTTNKKFGMSSINVPDKNSKIQVVKSAAVDLSGTYTIEFFVRVSASSTVGYENNIICTNDNVYPNRYSISVAAYSNGTMVGTITTPSDAVMQVTPVQSYTFGDWVHFAFVNDATAAIPNMSIYMNGTRVSNTPGTVVGFFNTNTFQVGKCDTAWAGTPYQIDDLKITNGIAKYSADFLVPTFEDAYYDTNFSSVSLLLHGTGANGSTIITDTSLVSKPVTAFGNAAISVAQSKFEGSSVYFNGSGDYLTIPDHADFTFSGGDFTVEAWVYTAATVTGTQAICGQWNTSLSWVLSIGANNTLVFESSTTGAYLGTRDVISPTSVVPVSTWTHVAATRNGDVFKLFINGTASTTLTVAGALFDSSELITVGRGGSGLQYFNGYIDDLRITKGIARYTSNFTPPTTAFPDR